MKSRFKTKKSTREIIDEAFLSPNLSSYFNQLKNLQKHKQLLFLHRYDLFGFEDEMQIPYIHLCNLPKKSKKYVIEDESKALPYFVSNELQVVERGKNLLSVMFGIDEKQWETMSEDLKDVLAYFVIYFIRNNPNIKKLIQSKNFDYKKMKDILKDYNNTIYFEAFSHDIERAFTTGKGDIDPIIMSKSQNLLIQFMAGIFKNLSTPKIICQISIGVLLLETQHLISCHQKRGNSLS